MATHAIGKLKFNLSKQGLAYRWGEGEIHRLFARKPKAGDADNEENYAGYQGEDYEIERHALGLHQVTLDFFLGFDNPAVPVYFKYSPTTPFKSSRGPKMHQLSFGFWF